MNKAKKLFTKFKQIFPTKLPLNRNDMDKFIQDILTANDLPDNKSYHHAVAGAIMHLGPVTASKSKRWFAKTVRKSIANQVAYEKIKSLQDDEKKAMEQEFLKDTPKAATLDGTIV